MNKKLCVYTCITGDYDDLHEIKNPEKNIDYYCFTNNKNLSSKTWKIIQIKNDGLDNQRLSRKIKMLGHPIISENYDTSVWVDASVVWEKPITEFVATYLKDTSFTAFKHSQRKTVREEAIACLRLHKDTKDSIVKTLNYLKSKHFPDDLGLYEMTVFVKKHNDPIVIKTMEIWFNLVKNYSKRDQLSFPYAIWQTGIKISPIDLSVWDNPWFYHTKHLATNSIDSCHIYYGNSDQEFDFNKYYIYDYIHSKNTYKINAAIKNDTNEIEINPVNITGAYFQNLIIEPTPEQLIFPQSITHGDKVVFCTGYGTIIVRGNFRKNQKLSISIDIFTPNTSELQQTVENLWLLSQQNHPSKKCAELTAQNQQLREDLHHTNIELQNILNSKRWKLFQNIRKLFPPY